MTKLSIIILSYNTNQLTNSCIDSLYLFYKDEIENGVFEILLVDNNSSDDTVETVKKRKLKGVTLIENKENYGFSKGNNIAISHAKGEYVLFLNSDTTVLDEGLKNMVSHLQKHDQIGILGGRLKNTDGTYQPSAGVFYTIFRIVLLLLGGERFGQLRFSPEKETKVDWLSGAMMMIKKDFFEKIGGFDEHIFMYMEDMELCFRVKKAGKNVVFFPECTVSHRTHASSNRTFAIVQIYKGIVYFYAKHQNALEYAVVKGLLFAKAYALIFIGTISGNAYLKNTYLQAVQVL